MTPQHPALRSSARDRVLRTASTLFYREGVRAVGMEAIVAGSGVAKTTIYRHFPTKDALVEAFLEWEDREFWSQWDAVTGADRGRPHAMLAALCAWIGDRVSRDAYRGCPQINVAAEFADPGHVARKVARRHKAEMIDRLTTILSDIDPANGRVRAQQVGLLFNGAFASGEQLEPLDAGAVLDDAVRRLTGD